MPEVYICAHCREIIDPETEEYVKWLDRWALMMRERISHAPCMLRKKREGDGEDP